MKRTTLAACTLAALLITSTSCNWFSKKNSNTSTSIVGKWKVDSLYPAGKDSSSLAYFFYALSKQGKDSVVIQFNADSTYSELPSKTAATKKYYQKNAEIFIQEDTTFQAYQLSFTDSTASLLGKDSMRIVLKKQ